MDHHEPATLERLTQAFLEGRCALPQPWASAPLGLCLSGGADSCALALVAARARSESPNAFAGGIVGYHARHALRGSESQGDAASVRELCGRLGLALVELDAKVDTGPGLEARAREARYHSLREAAGRDCLLATAHHRDDQAETVLQRLLRGAGVVGLRGVHSLRHDGIWRPLLATSHRGLLELCRRSGWEPREDSSNADLSFQRNFLRHQFLPPLELQVPGITDQLVALALSAQALEPFLESALGRLASQVRLQIDASGFSADFSACGPDLASDPELEILLERTWTRCGRRPWAGEQRRRLLDDIASGGCGRRLGGQGERAIWGARRLRLEKIQA